MAQAWAVGTPIHALVLKNWPVGRAPLTARADIGWGKAKLSLLAVKPVQSGPGNMEVAPAGLLILAGTAACALHPAAGAPNGD